MDIMFAMPKLQQANPTETRQKDSKTETKKKKRKEKKRKGQEPEISKEHI